MANKFLIPIFIILIFSLIYNYVSIDERMNFFKNDNLKNTIGMGLTIIGMIVVVVYYRLNNLNQFIEKKKEELFKNQ